MKITLLVLISLTMVLSGCSRLSTKQQQAVKEALDALGKLKAATQVGVNYQHYGTLLIEAKAKVNAAAEVLADGEVKKNLNESIQAYADAGTYWGQTIDGFVYINTDLGKLLMEKYKVPEPATSYFPDKQFVLTYVWSIAETYRQRASDLAGV